MSSPVKVLYVDDEVRNLSSFKRNFRRKYNIDLAESAKAGIALMKNNDYHIVLADQRMPETTGVEFFEEINKNYPDAMRILITAYTDIEAVIQAINQGEVYKYITKPYEESELEKVFEDAYKVYQFKKQVNQDIKKYKEVFQNSTEPIFLINANGEFVEINESCSQVLEMDRSQLFETPINSFFNKKAQKQAFFTLLKNNQEVEDFELEIKSDEKVIHALVSIRKFFMPDANIDLYQGSIKNISRIRKETTELISNLVKNQESEKRVLADLLHESLAQKLAGIKFYMSTLKDLDQTHQQHKVIDTANLALDKAFDELREVCFNLLPRSLSISLQQALVETADRYAKNFDTSIEINLQAFKPQEEKRIKWYRVINEILFCFSKVANGEKISVHHSENAEFCVKTTLQVPNQAVLDMENFKVMERKIKNFEAEISHRFKDGKIELSIKL